MVLQKMYQRHLFWMYWSHRFACTYYSVSNKQKNRRFGLIYMKLHQTENDQFLHYVRVDTEAKLFPFSTHPSLDAAVSRLEKTQEKDGSFFFFNQILLSVFLVMPPLKWMAWVGEWHAFLFPTRVILMQWDEKISKNFTTWGSGTQYFGQLCIPVLLPIATVGMT